MAAPGQVQPDWDVADYLDEHLDGWREANQLTGARIDSPDAAECELASWANPD